MSIGVDRDRSQFASQEQRGTIHSRSFPECTKPVALGLSLGLTKHSDASKVFVH
jgi:hypothetical protein